MNISDILNNLNKAYCNAVFSATNEYSRGYYDGTIKALNSLGILTEYSDIKDRFVALHLSNDAVSDIIKYINDLYDKAYCSVLSSVRDNYYTKIEAVIDLLDILGYDCYLDKDCKKIERIALKEDKDSE